MKFKPFFTVVGCCAITLFTACKNDTAASKDAVAETPSAATSPVVDPAPTAIPPGAMAVDPTATSTAPPPTTKVPEPPQNAAGVWHYTCAKGCAGGSGAATACAKCGATLAHNAAYHGTPGAAATPDKAAVKAPEPAQNKAGVWHYTCADGCAGGAGVAATPCAKCGKPLAHNAAYHQ